MKECISATVAGGDLRQVYAANLLAEKGFAVSAIGFSGEEPFSEQVSVTADLSVLEEAELLLLPLGVSREGRLNTPLYEGEILLEDCFRRISPNCQTFCGNLTEEEKRLAEHYNISIHDYFKVEELTVANAVLTAEASIQLAMEQLPRSLWNSKVLICGGGRIARALLPRLKAFGAEVTLAARRPEQRIWAAAEGVKTVSLSALPAVLGEQDLVLNTVPAVLLKEAELSRCSADCLLLELASPPYGIDFAAAEKLGRRAVLASALPGKHSPRSAGEWIANTVLSMRKG